jgi:hypothetical protein
MVLKLSMTFEAFVTDQSRSYLLCVLQSTYDQITVRVQRSKKKAVRQLKAEKVSRPDRKEDLGNTAILSSENKVEETACKETKRGCSDVIPLFSRQNGGVTLAGGMRVW